MCRRNCGCESRGNLEDGIGGVEGRRNPCSPNPQRQHFDRVLGTWQTVRHYTVNSHDTIRPICGGSRGEPDFDRLLGGRDGNDGVRGGRDVRHDRDNEQCDCGN
ncbi:MAG: hypothetical protein FWC82_01560 [Firmicutes bacterium]|nr:hypothetical protein [Bacillota bacterium]